MSWSDVNRQEHSRTSDCYPSDLANVEWIVLEALLPIPSLAAVPERRIYKI